MLEFLTESDVPDSVKDVVDVIGIDAFKGLVKLAGGSLLYIPNESNLVKPIRNRSYKREEAYCNRTTNSKSNKCK